MPQRMQSGLDLTGHLIHSGLKLRDVADTLDFIAFADGRVFFMIWVAQFDAALEMLLPDRLCWISLTSNTATPITHTHLRLQQQGHSQEGHKPICRMGFARRPNGAEHFTCPSACA